MHISVQPRELTNQRDNNNNLLNPYRIKTRLNVFSFPTFSFFRIEYSSISFPVAFSLSPPLQISQGEAFAATTAPAASPSAVQTAAKFPQTPLPSLFPGAPAQHENHSLPYSGVLDYHLCAAYSNSSRV
jgi:hypothetical protein